MSILSNTADTRPAVTLVPADLHALLAGLHEREAAAEAAERRYLATFDQPAIGIAHVAPDLSFLSVSDGLCTFTGYSRQELLALNFAAISHPDDVQPNLAQAQRLAVGELDGYALEKRYLRKDGAVAWGHLTGSLLRDVTGAALYTVMVVVDITERKAAAAEWLAARVELERQRAAVDAALRDSAAGIAVVEAPSGRLLYHNEEAARLVHHPESASLDPASVPGGSGALHLDGRYYAVHEYPLNRALAGEVVHQEEILYCRGDGMLTHLSVSAAPVHDSEGRVVLAVTSFEDLSARRRLEEDLREAEARAASANAAKASFISMMSHELRTPITSILGFCDLLLMGVPEAVGPHAAEQVDRVRSSARHLLALIDEVLAYARLETGARLDLAWDPLEIGEVLHAVSEMLQPAARAKRLELRVECPGAPLTARTDRHRLQQILLNLTANAIRYTEVGGVTLAAARDGQELVVTVRDSGIGIAPEHVERIFDPFWQVDSARGRPAGGVGVGLAVSQRLARLLGGELRVESELGKGSAFSLALPAEPAPAPHELTGPG